MTGKTNPVYVGGCLLWALPWTLVGIALGALAVASGGRAGLRGGILEFSGGLLVVLLRRVPITGGASAITLGHAVLARNREALERTRCHERVHVRQYERWGPLFVPIYFLASGREWLRGNDPYRDNPFEREAYAREDAGPTGSSHFSP